MAREYFCAYHSLIESLEPFSDAEKGRLFTSALVYSREGAEPQLVGNERFIWPTIRAMIDRDKRAYADVCSTRREAGAKGGKQKVANQANASKSYQEEEKEEDKDEGEEKEDISSPDGEGDKARAKRFAPPTVEEVAAYCAERNNGVDPETFVDHYQSNGWKVGGKSPMKDWRAAVRTWEKNEYNRPSAKNKRGASAAQKIPEWDDEKAIEQLERLRAKLESQSKEQREGRHDSGV